MVGWHRLMVAAVVCGCHHDVRGYPLSVSKLKASVAWPPWEHFRLWMELMGLVLPAVPTTDPEWLFVEEGYTLAREHELE